tara:strand:+ start:764 stop:1081 length:318 start_codon:yes stop_codon:yes gene_type:complete
MTQTVLIIALLGMTGIFVFMLFYIRWLLRTISNIDNKITELWIDISKFNNHLQSVHNTEMFYGDATLQALIEHSQSLSENIETIKDFFLPEEGGEYENESQEKEE